MSRHGVADDRAQRSPMDDFGYMSDFPRWSDQRCAVVGTGKSAGFPPLVGLGTMLGLSLNRVNGREIRFPLSKIGGRDMMGS
jgi:hypothetical protein